MEDANGAEQCERITPLDPDEEEAASLELPLDVVAQLKEPHRKSSVSDSGRTTLPLGRKASPPPPRD